MNSKEVSERAREILVDMVGITSIIEPSTQRFEGVGAEQYETCVDAGHGEQECTQKFEDYSMTRLVDELMDEIVDQANYAIMLLIAHPTATALIIARDVIRNANSMYSNLENIKRYVLPKENNER